MIPPKSTIYLAGPMTGYEGYNHLAFVGAAVFLRDTFDLAVHNPAKSFGGRKDLPATTYMRHDIGMILTSDAVVFLPGWEGSKGATCEAYVAQALGLPRFLLDGDTLKPLTGELPTLSLTRDINGWVDEVADNMDDPLLKADGFDDCVIGICYRFGSSPHVVYDRKKMISKLMSDGLTEEDAEEHFEFNIAGAWAGDTTPGFIDTP